MHTQIARRCRSTVGSLCRPAGDISWRSDVILSSGPTSAQRRQTKRSVQRRLNVGKPSGRSNVGSTSANQAVGPTAAQQRHTGGQANEGPPNIHDHQYIKEQPIHTKNRFFFKKVYYSIKYNISMISPSRKSTWHLSELLHLL